MKTRYRKKVFILVMFAISFICFQNSFANNTSDIFSINATSGTISVTRRVKENEHLVSMCEEQYTLSGAEYSIYADQTCTTSVGVLTCGMQKKDAAGKLYSETQAINLENGIYYVKETKASKCYEPDTAPYYEVVVNGNSNIINIDALPKFEPMNMSMTFQAAQKEYVDDGSIMKYSTPEYQKYFEGIGMEISYYPTYYSSVDEAKLQEPLRKWVFRADKNGQIKYADAWKQTTGLSPEQRCDELFKDEKGNPVGLYGTYIFTQLDNPENSFTKYSQTPSLKQLTENQNFENLSAKNTTALCVNPPNAYITIKNDVPTADIYSFANALLGNAGYAIYCIEGVDMFGEKVKEYHGIYPFDNQKKEIREWTIAGKYTVKEIKRARYDGHIKNASSGCRVDGNTIYIDFFEKDEIITYESVVRRWDNLSYCRMKINEYIPL